MTSENMHFVSVFVYNFAHENVTCSLVEGSFLQLNLEPGCVTRGSQFLLSFHP